MIEIFRDDFSGAYLNESQWFKQKDAAFIEQCYDVDNIRLEAGHLVMGTGSRLNGSQTILTGSAIFTWEKFNFTYGEMIIRAKFPLASDLSASAFIALKPCRNSKEHDCTDSEMLPALQLWVSSLTPRVVYGGVMYKGRTGRELTYMDYYFCNEDRSSGYHVVQLVWTHDFVAWYVDEEMVLNQTVSGFSTWPRLFTLYNKEYYSQPNFPFNATDAPEQEFWIDYISVQQLTDAVRRDHALQATVGTIIAILLIISIAMKIGFGLRRRRQRHCNMQKQHFVDVLFPKIYSQMFV
ncbi:uncharacterized protein LOC129596927 [Paramacrobiotus metropolitanus]|uniref:uncharacterized protein LOC129596927 n=1 Tax=Paramacrobiotus metropolitanus TaxID=2943436 RepID=UPI002445A7A9|nr:uncharacterized protein LOC129596927 [Paramacrobiotus metropolitanus]